MPIPANFAILLASGRDEDARRAVGESCSLATSLLSSRFQTAAVAEQNAMRVSTPLRRLCRVAVRTATNILVVVAAIDDSRVVAAATAAATVDR